MSKWTCPDCRGGFPELTTDEDGTERCPWCGAEIMDLTELGYSHQKDYHTEF